jgi:hypothetical protein
LVSIAETRLSLIAMVSSAKARAFSESDLPCATLA